MLFPGDNHPAAVGRDFKALFALKIQSFRRQYFEIELSLEYAFAERKNLFDIFGVDKDPAFSVIFFTDQVCELKSGTAVKIPFGIDVQVPDDLSVFKLKFCAHGFDLLRIVRKRIWTQINIDERRLLRHECTNPKPGPDDNPYAEIFFYNFLSPSNRLMIIPLISSLMVFPTPTRDLKFIRPQPFNLLFVLVSDDLVLFM